MMAFLKQNASANSMLLLFSKCQFLKKAPHHESY